MEKKYWVKENTRSVSCRVTDKEFKAIEKLAKKRGITMSIAMRECISSLFTKKETKDES